MKDKKTIPKASTKKVLPAITPEDREQQLISMSYDLAERQILEGTATSQVITHFLRLGSQRESYEKQLLLKKAELLEQQVEELKSAKRTEELYSQAIDAMMRYSGQRNDDDYED